MENLQVLIVENERDIAGFFKMVLELEGFQCELAHTAKEALFHLATNVPDLILLDLHLGVEVNGQDILYQIRINPLFNQTRVVVVTAFPQVAEFVGHLADLVLLKPVDAEQLKTLVQRITSLEYTPKSLTFVDPVTGLYNQVFFNLRLEHAFERAKRRPDFLYGVTLLRAQVLEAADDTLQEEAVSGLYQQLAQDLRRCLRTTDTVTRLANWKFAILLEEMKQVGDSAAVEARLRAAIKANYRVGEQEFRLRIYLGSEESQTPFSHPRYLLEAAEARLKACSEAAV